MATQTAAGLTNEQKIAQFDKIMAKRDSRKSESKIKREEKMKIIKANFPAYVAACAKRGVTIKS